MPKRKAGAKETGEQYAPGVCNIDGPARRRRAFFGFLMLAITFALWYYLKFVRGAGLIVQTVLFIPALLAFMGFWQARLRFCMGDARKKQYEMGGQVGTVSDEASIRRDAERANQIFFYATVSALLLTLLLMLI